MRNPLKTIYTSENVSPIILSLKSGTTDTTGKSFRTNKLPFVNFATLTELTAHVSEK